MGRQSRNGSERKGDERTGEAVVEWEWMGVEWSGPYRQAWDRNGFEPTVPDAIGRRPLTGSPFHFAPPLAQAGA